MKNRKIKSISKGLGIMPFYDLVYTSFYRHSLTSLPVNGKIRSLGQSYESLRSAPTFYIWKNIDEN
jgi:hypothetical protein